MHENECDATTLCPPPMMMMHSMALGWLVSYPSRRVGKHHPVICGSPVGQGMVRPRFEWSGKIIVGQLMLILRAQCYTVFAVYRYCAGK